jgi:hypothetical protein
MLAARVEQKNGTYLNNIQKDRQSSPSPTPVAVFGICPDRHSHRRLADARRQARLGQQAIHRVREGRRLVLDEKVAPGDGLDSLGAQRGRDDGLPHGHGLDDLEAGAAAQPQWHDNGCGRREVRPQVRHEAGQLDPGPGQRLERRWLQRDNYDGRLPTIKLAKSGSRRVASRELPV